MSIDNEQRLVISLMNDFDSSFSRLDSVSVAMFSDKDSRELFEAILTIHEEGDKVDPVSVLNTCKMSAYDLSVYSEKSYSSPDAVPIDCAEIVGEWQQREITLLMQKNIHADLIPSERATAIKNGIDNILNVSPTGSKSFVETMDSWRSDYSEWYDGNRPQGIKTGYWFLDNLLRYKPGNLITIGARTGIGKTTFALNQVARMADDGISVGLISLEMSSYELVDKLFGITASMAPKDIYNKSSFARVIKESAKVEKLPIYIEAPLYNDAQKIFNIVRRLVSNGIKIVFIDYLQLLAHAGRFQNRNYEIGKITGSLKSLASELGIPIVILSQLRRKEGNPAPELSDLRDSGSIEQDSNIVIFLHQKEKGFNVTAEMECRISKNRGGGVGMEDVIFKKDLSLITAKDQFHE